MSMQSPFSALYLHIPFCVKRCSYCDFSTRACTVDDPAIDEHVRSLVLSIRRASKAGLFGNIETIYIGGGTPSYLGLARISEILYALSLSINLENCSEITMEANPDSLTEQMVKDIYALGVDRLSMGIQSLDDDVLRTLGRVHDAKKALQAIEIARTRFENVSADVICGVMGQSEASLEATISKLIDAGITHASIYPLMLEDGTPLTNAVDRGELDEPDDDAQADHMLLAGTLFEEAGFSRYEVASYAKPGFESKHNTAYWTGKPYLGLGTGAASMLEASDLDCLLDSGALDLWTPSEARVGRPAFDASSRARISLEVDGPSFEFLSPREAACEDAMLAMRMSRGIDGIRLGELASRCPELLPAFERIVATGLAYRENDRIKPTTAGWLLGNELYGEIWDCATD